ncbi:hypothetical protein M885DRAFT_544358 [Pelagophyceae sp. CCMP2097]|nr:hypothetical protein M885DRAFT_544358 [Pelagophyceae sp. CCMP2097]|mmetsp:Transcript_14612/g.50798  ORF Transcript_14612/g.50798 Transcript_14612/m.50798 type:complete len:342 (-) Transcript_14612:1196-2221(-)
MVRDVKLKKLDDCGCVVEVRRVSLGVASFSALAGMAEMLFGWRDCAVSYDDDEGDRVTIASDLEFVSSLGARGGSPDKPLCFYVQRHAGDEPPRLASLIGAVHDDAAAECPRRAARECPQASECPRASTAYYFLRDAAPAYTADERPRLRDDDAQRRALEEMHWAEAMRRSNLEDKEETHWAEALGAEIASQRRPSFTLPLATALLEPLADPGADAAAHPPDPPLAACADAAPAAAAGACDDARSARGSDERWELVADAVAGADEVAGADTRGSPAAPRGDATGRPFAVEMATLTDMGFVSLLGEAGCNDVLERHAASASPGLGVDVEAVVADIISQFDEA